MRITLLGTGSADGWPNPFCRCDSCSSERGGGRARRPSSALIDDVVLIDCGPTTPHLPAGSGVDLANVEHALITHGHPDHLHPAFLLTRRWTTPSSLLHVWGPPLAMDMCRDWLGPDSAVVLHPVAPGDTVRLPSAGGEYHVAVIPAAHAHGDGDAIAAEAVLYAITAPDDARLLYATDTGPLPLTATDTIGAALTGAADVVLIDETFGDTLDHGTGHLDLARLPDVLDTLRTSGAIDARTRVVATHLSHHNPPTSQLQARLRPMGVEVLDDLAVIDTALPTATLPRPTPQRHLIIGGARSGKSVHAEQLAATFADVTYVATGGTRDGDTEWTERVDRHRARRPSSWHTIETTDVSAVLAVAPAGSVVLVDCLSLWLTAALDDLAAWQRAEDGLTAAVLDDIAQCVDALVISLQACAADVILVSNEVGMGVVPATVSGRLFRDAMGTLNARVAGVCTRTTYLVAGRPLPLGAIDAH